MNNKGIYFGPFVVLGLDYYWSTLVNPFANGAYNFGFGLGMFLIIAIPCAIVAAIHQRMTNKNLVDPSADLLEDVSKPKKRRGFFFFFSSYITVVGIALFFFLLISQS